MEEKASAHLRGDRPEFAAAPAESRPGDTLGFWKSDRWGRSAAHVLTVVTEQQADGIAAAERRQESGQMPPGVDHLSVRKARASGAKRSSVKVALWPRPG
ncbi:recombinase family protein [Nonomuraea solani]|uniref:recombinase family protein n=1 Tax=Nonomuraea solani TaxID=1144553 RepID=UPI003898D7A6